MSNHTLILPIARQVELVLVSLASWAFFEYHLWLNLCFQKGHLLSSAMCLPLQLMHLKVWGHGSPLAVSSLGELSLKLALQHYTKSLWCSNLWGPLHFWHFEPWAWHKNVEWPHFQQLWHQGTLGFMLVALMVVTYLPKLKEWFISNFALDSFWESQISNQMIAMSDLGEALITLDFAVRFTGSNSSRYFMVVVMSSPVSLLPLGCI